MAVFPDPLKDDEPESIPAGDPLNPNPPVEVPEDPVRVYERPEQAGGTGTSLITILAGLILLIVLGYLAYQFIF
jgi:hypothetical protein